MIGQRVLAQLEDGSLIDCGVITGWTDGRDGFQFTTERYPESVVSAESLPSKASELAQLCMDMGLGF